MTHTLHRRLALLALAMSAVVAGVVGLPPSMVSAHNTLLSSDPADGADLSVAPTQISWMFDNAVPLETMTVTLIDATGARVELGGSVHGAAGDAEVVTPLPQLEPGSVSLRWRLVGADGHPITGRVGFTIAAGTPTTTAAETPTAETNTAETNTAATTNTAAIGDASLDGDGSYSTPSLVRWVLRYASYLAIMATIGILLTSAYVWTGAAGHPLLRLVLGRSLVATAALGFLHVLVVASDVSGKAPWSSFSSIDAAITTDAGMAFAIRLVLALTMWLLLFRSTIAVTEVYWTAVSFASLGLLATWAFAGHSRSMRWPAIGVVTDVAHHAAAAIWITGLAIVACIAIPTTPADVIVPTMRRFSRVAAISVAVLVVTGLVQAVRLVGSPMNLLDADHGRYLVAKVVMLAAMLSIANANRRRVDQRLDDPATLGRHTGALRRAMFSEFALGLVIVAITAAMVVSTPSSVETGAGAPGDERSARILHDVVPPARKVI